jgi:hypothetical protein
VQLSFEVPTLCSGFLQGCRERLKPDAYSQRAKLQPIAPQLAKPDR